MKTAASVALTFDSWTSRKTQPFMAVTAHWLDVDVEPNTHIIKSIKSASACLAMLHAPESHTGEYMANMLKGLIDAYGLKDRVSCLVHDNAANARNAAEAMKIPHINCYAHSLQLVVRGALKPFDHLLRRLSRLVSAFHNKHGWMDTLKQLFGIFSSHLDPKPDFVEPIKNVLTRWSSDFAMLESLLDKIKAINMTLEQKCAAVKDVDVVVDSATGEAALSSKDRITDDDAATMEVIFLALAPLKAATEALEGEMYPTLMLALPEWVAIESALRRPFDDGKEAKGDGNEAKGEAVTRNTKKLHTALVKQFADRFVSCKMGINANPGAFIAVFCHPQRREMKWLPEDMQVSFEEALIKEVMSFVRIAATTNNAEQAVAFATKAAWHNSRKRKLDALPSVQAVKKIKLEGLDGVSVIKKPVIGDLREAAVKAIKEYRDVELVVDVKQKQDAENEWKPQQVLDWWAKHGRALPIMFLVACKWLAVPATSAPSERVFSAAARTHTSLRASMAPKTLEMMVFLKKNMALAASVVAQCAAKDGALKKAAAAPVAAAAAAVPAAAGAASPEGGAGSGAGAGSGSAAPPRAQPAAVEAPVGAPQLDAAQSAALTVAVEHTVKAKLGLGGSLSGWVKVKPKSAMEEGDDE